MVLTSYRPARGSGAGRTAQRTETRLGHRPSGYSGLELVAAKPGSGGRPRRPHRRPQAAATADRGRRPGHGACGWPSSARPVREGRRTWEWLASSRVRASPNLRMLVLHQPALREERLTGYYGTSPSFRDGSGIVRTEVAAA